MDNYIKINYKGKEYIGQIESIQSTWESVIKPDYSRDLRLQYYSVAIIEKDTNVHIKDIIINSFSEIKPYN